MARPEESEELKGARGTLRADRQRGTVEHTPLKEMYKTPSGLLTRLAKLEYRRVSRLLIDEGIAAEADRSLLVAYCNEMASYRTWSKEIAECEDLKIPPRKGLPYQCNQALKNAMKLGEMFGLTPSARGKIKPSKAKKKAAGDSTAEQFESLMKTG